MQSPYEPDDEFDRLVYGTDEDKASEDFDTSENGPKLFFPNLEVFVTDFLVHHYARPLDPMSHDKELTWCSSWWAHTEAVSRLSALWRAWETLRLDAGPGSCGPPAGTPRRSSRPPRTRPGRPGSRSHHGWLPESSRTSMYSFVARRSDRVPPGRTGQGRSPRGRCDRCGWRQPPLPVRICAVSFMWSSTARAAPRASPVLIAATMLVCRCGLILLNA